MDRKVLMWIVIGVLFVSVLFLTFKAGSPSTGIATTTAQAATSAGQSASAASYGGMVGGC